MASMRRSALTMTAAGLLSLLTAAGGAVANASPAAGIKGDPQPETAPFVIGASNYGGGSIAMEPNGTLVVARGDTSGYMKIIVCVLDRGARKCASSVTLSPPGGDSLYGFPEVFIPSANHVVVLMGTSESDLLFSSDNGGKTFAAPVQVGTLAVGAAALVGDNVVFTEGDDRYGAEVESVPVTTSGPPVGQPAVATEQEAYDVAVGSYKDGALIGSDYDGTDYTTYVAYAAAESNFNTSSSYHNVGSFAHEQLIAMSGDALLTKKTTGNEALELRLFNGKSFGAVHTVPGTTGGGPEWFAVAQDPSGRVHVFSERAFSPRTYDLYEASTVTGASWTSAVDLGYAAASDYFSEALDADGTGLVLGTGSDEPAWGFPVLATQSATFSLRASKIGKGHATAGSGVASPAAKGRVVDLQVERSGLWYTGHGRP